MRRAPSFELEPARLTSSLKGKALAVTAYALRAADRQTAATRHRRHTLPMIGRDDQLAVLDRHIVETADGRGQVVAITAGAGLGKSRLLVEAARLLSERGHPGLRGRGAGVRHPGQLRRLARDLGRCCSTCPRQLSRSSSGDLLHDRVRRLDPDRCCPGCRCSARRSVWRSPTTS